MPGPPSRRRDVALALLLALASGGLYAATRQEHLWGDGEILLGLAREGDLRILNKLLFAPLFALARGALALAGIADDRAAFLALSAGCTALAVGATFLAARAAGTSALGSALAAGLLALAPATWFFATTVEVHPPQLAAAALSFLWAARAHRAGTLGADALPLALVLVAVAGTHLTGFFWAPALVTLGLWSARRGRPPRRLVPAALVAGAFLALVFLVKPALVGTPVTENVGVADVVRATVRDFPWSPRLLAQELGLGALLLLAAPVAWLLLRPPRTRAARELVLVALVLAAPFVLLLPAFPAESRGGYHLSLFPLLALGAAALHRALPRLATPALAVALVVQGAVARHGIEDWQERYPRAEWLAAIERDTAGRCLVLADDELSIGIVGRWTTWTALGIDQLVPLGPPSALADWAAAHDLTLVVMRPLHETRVPHRRAFLDGLAEATGGPVPGSHPAYVLHRPRARGEDAPGG